MTQTSQASCWILRSRFLPPLVQFFTDFNSSNWRAGGIGSWSRWNLESTRWNAEFFCYRFILTQWVCVCSSVGVFLWFWEMVEEGRWLSWICYCCCSMKRKPISPKLLIRHKWKTKIFALLLVGFCFSTFLLMEAQYSRIGASSIFPLFVQKPKIAFLFLARNRLPLDLVWDEFFQVNFRLDSLSMFLFSVWNSRISVVSCLIHSFTLFVRN